MKPLSWVAALLLVSACGNRAAENQAVTLRFWGLGREGEVVSELVKDFEREHPDIRVRVQQVPWSAAHEKLLTAFVGKASPDLAQLGNTWIPEFVALKALVPLDSAIGVSSTIDSSRFFPGIWKTNQIEGVTYGIPWYVDTRLVFYRKDILRRAGYQAFPTSWDEWLAAMRAIKRQVGPHRYPIYLPINEWVPTVVLGLQAGSPLLKDHDGRGAFSDSAFRRGVDYYLSIFRDSLAPVKGLNDVANVYQEFERGTFAMWITGPWNLGEFRRRLPDSMQSSWATAPVPGPTGAASGVSLAGGASIVIFRSSPHPREAWLLLEFLSRPEQQRRFYELTGDLPARIDAWTPEWLAADSNRVSFWAQLQRVVPTPLVPEWEQIATMVLDHSEQAVRGGVPADVVLRNLDRNVNALLEKRRWMLEHGTLAAGSR
jgi:multiple sugar transport system substrate-binding protein